ncbi:hypothetical protein V6N13_023064 [Hibiscus sabdariffa]
MDTSPTTEANKVCNRDDYFRYDNCWATGTDCFGRVHTAWQYTSGTTIDKLHVVSRALKTWQNERRNDTTNRISELQGFLDKCMHKSMIASEQQAFLSANR